MAIKSIVTIPDETLRQKTKKVKIIDDTVKELIQDLKDTVLSAKDPEGAGLAATQIGSDKRVCIVRDFFRDPENEEVELSTDYILVNPKIISKSKEMDMGYEGCLSVPDTYGRVERHRKIKVKAQDENGDPLRLSASGFFARVIQHEVDHLDGVLFTDKVIGETLTESELEEMIKKAKEKEQIQVNNGN